MRTSNSTSGAIAVTNALITLLSEQPEGLVDAKGYELNNTGSTALSDFQLQVQLRSGGAWFTALAAADWAAIIAGTKAMPAFLLGVWTNPATLAGSGNSGFLIQPAGIYGVRFQAQTASSSTTVTLNGSGRALR